MFHLDNSLVTCHPVLVPNLWRRFAYRLGTREAVSAFDSYGGMQSIDEAGNIYDPGRLTL